MAVAEEIVGVVARVAEQADGLPRRGCRLQGRGGVAEAAGLEVTVDFHGDRVVVVVSLANCYAFSSFSAGNDQTE